MIRVAVIATAGELTPLEQEVAAELAQAVIERDVANRARYLGNNLGAAKQAGSRTDAGNPSPSKPALLDGQCLDCHEMWFIDHERRSCATHRAACESCGRNDVPLHTGDLSKKLGENGAELWERWCSHCDPVVVGEKHADGKLDPWDLDSEEQFTTVPLPRETPAYWGRDRAEYDAADDRSDIRPFSRTEKP